MYLLKLLTVFAKFCVCVCVCARVYVCVIVLCSPVHFFSWRENPLLSSASRRGLYLSLKVAYLNIVT